MYNNYDYYIAHTGVVGMKWGVRRAAYKSGRIEKLEKKSYNYDKRSAKLNKLSERRHSKYDLESKNKYARKAANYSIKSAKLSKRAVKTDDDWKQVKLESRAEKLLYKGAKNTLKANRISKTTGYGLKAMRYSIKSDKVAIKAANARRKIANDKKYIAMMDRKMSSLSKEKLAKVEADWFGPAKLALNNSLDNVLNPKPTTYINDHKVRTDPKTGAQYVSLYR